MTRNKTVAGLFAAIAVYFFIYSFQYSIGSASKMGPAYFPILTSVSLLAVSMLIWFFDRDQTSAKFNWDVFSIGVPLGAIFVFAINLETLGFAITSFLVVLLTALSKEGRHLGLTLGTGIVLIAIGYSMMKYLNVYLPMWPRI
jgi:high-affinity Fe2+/Pb2+ permease